MLLHKILDILAPHTCLACNLAIEHPLILCEACSQSLELLELAGRCPRCFSRQEGARCLVCAQGAAYDQALSCFEYFGPITSVLRIFKYGNRPYLAKGLASFILVQAMQNKVPIPDCITCVPMTPLRRWLRGYNQSALLAQALSEQMDVPYRALLKKGWADLPQAGLDRESRLKSASVGVKRQAMVADKDIWLIDDVWTTGTTVDICATALKEAGAKHVTVLTLARVDLGVREN